MSVFKDPSCETCSKPNSSDNPLYWCSVCEVLFCGGCWEGETLHKPGVRNAAGRTRKPHEKTNIALADLILNILDPPDNEDLKKKQVQANIDTKWFAIEEQITGEARFHDLGRFVHLSRNSDKNPAEQFPCLVSFVGETGAGKSTLINALMKMHGGIDEVTPVMGHGATADVSTSGDVHLFSDPKTYHTGKRPIYYADCEGLEGGTHLLPMGSMALQLKLKKLGTPHESSRVRIIKYDKAKKDEKKTRQWAIENLFPRVLFTFSEVVCLVTQNFRKIEDHIEKLLRWADSALAKSVNQPMLPVAIIVVNAVSQKQMRAKNWCAVEELTAEQLKRYKDMVNEIGVHVPNGLIFSLAQTWRKRGRKIDTLQDLLNCYYSGFKIICVPEAEYTPSAIKEQYQKLYDSIKNTATLSGESRSEIGLLMSSEDLSSYLDYAFEHFSTNDTEPFNFNDAAFLINPVAKTFKDHIVRLAIYLRRETPESELGDGKNLFCNDVAPLLASSIFLTATRKHIALRGSHTDLIRHYRQIFLEAHNEFYSDHWLCEATDKKGNRCINTLKGHKKGHQRLGGKPFGNGPFQTSFNSKRYYLQAKFLDEIERKLQNLVVELKQKRKSLDGLAQEDKEAAQIHLNRTLTANSCIRKWKSRDKDIDPTKPPPLISYTTCFCCLSAAPVHALTCQHVICQSCLESFSDFDKENLLRVLDVCPLCCNIKNPWKTPWATSVKPPTAGLRILSLDGGGIRSLVQLKILQELETLINIGMPIQEFFDLIVGTSGGGIVAYGLGARRLGVVDCIKEFKELSHQAFTKRVGAGWGAGIGALVEAKHHSIYKSRGLEEALKRVFGEAPMFGGDSCVQEKPIKVGLTTTSSNRQHPFLLANYNRSEPIGKNIPYKFFRPDSPESELKDWEAVRASAAAPLYFKPFFHSQTGHTFSDGGIKFNNPAALADIERKIIWANMAEQDPDILLSLGTGYQSHREKRDDPGPKFGAGIGGFARRMMKLGFEIIRDSIDCERNWEEYLRTVGFTDGKEDIDRDWKYCRLNPDFSDVDGGLPSLDAVDKMDTLISRSRDFVKKDPKVMKVAATLVASLFYFEALPQTSQAKDPQQIQGNILCRLAGNSPQLRKLMIRLQCFKNYDHIFLISNCQEYYFNLGEAKDYQAAFDRVKEGKRFCLPVNVTHSITKIRIYLRFWEDINQRAPISGFPRFLGPENGSLHSETGPNKHEPRRATVSSSVVIHIERPKSAKPIETPQLYSHAKSQSVEMF